MRILVIVRINSNLRGVAMLEAVERVYVAERRDQFLAEINLSFGPELVTSARCQHPLVETGDVLLIFSGGGQPLEVRNRHAELGQHGVDGTRRSAAADGIRRH